MTLSHDDKHGLVGKWERKQSQKKSWEASEIIAFLERLSNHVRILDALDVTTSHGMLHVVSKLFPISP